ncbi:MAG: hypothetical protein AMJ54_02005 [Deltaproteobacteria bacterium SG8_13]|nr:MAG: hypothetical protein AMJ54_02005 [Deltaproteobacteria bacterium SG8_13]
MSRLIKVSRGVPLFLPEFNPASLGGRFDLTIGNARYPVNAPQNRWLNPNQAERSGIFAAVFTGNDVRRRFLLNFF